MEGEASGQARKKKKNHPGSTVGQQSICHPEGRDRITVEGIAFEGTSQCLGFYLTCLYVSLT